MAGASAPTSTRSRSFGGCATCRGRHVKCDEQRPTCYMCRSSRLLCGGYERSIFFDLPFDSDDTTVRFRRPLFTEKERERMSRWLTVHVPPEKALRVLAQIDNECETAAASKDFHVYRGPFGAFKVNQTHPDPVDSLHLAHVEGSISPEQIESVDLSQFSAEAMLPPLTPSFVQSLFDSTDPFFFPPSLDFLDTPFDHGNMQEMFDQIQNPPITHLSAAPSPVVTSNSPHFTMATQFTQITSPPSISSVTFAKPGTLLPEHTVPLLQHYTTTVVRSLSPFRHSKTPWHVIFLQYAKNCLAALTMDEQVDHATLCSFHGTLAISAFSLGKVRESQMWLDHGTTYKERAELHGRLMLKAAYDTPKVAKYKSILVALLNLVQVSFLSGERDSTERYLLETERFVRLRGLNRRKSRKIRLLHHCYVYMRIFHESTFISDINSSQRRHVWNDAESAGVMIRPQDSPPFSLICWSNLDEQMLEVKSQEEGENDLHLEKPGVFNASMYPEIYGIPEKWMFLFSQVIRLGNEKDKAKCSSSKEALSLKNFLCRAKALEDQITSVQHPKSMAGSSSYSSLPSELSEVKDVLDAMQFALSIYFYRRIHNVDASILQHKVARVRDCLSRCERAESGVVYGCIWLIWPAFIAACEAEDPQLQISFSDWFKTYGRRTGLACFTDTLESCERLWRDRNRSNGMKVTWLDLARKNIISQENA